MTRLKNSQEMAKNGKVSEELLKDEEFKSKLKEALKKETGKEITNDQISEIIKNFEIALQDKELLKEADLENVSGGGAKANAIKYSSAILGAALFSVTGRCLGYEAGYRIGLYNSVYCSLEIKPYVVCGRHLGTSIGAISGFEGGWEFGEYLCKKWKIGDKENKK